MRVTHVALFLSQREEEDEEEEEEAALAYRERYMESVLFFLTPTLVTPVTIETATA